ncbi:hypothetical protein V8G54_000765 [Vigna mungo]|uniref:Uncharacterized protein n=1 Tax=Vigna mungo TaxID=3915 RepID=A0AAQ3P730_VIGMU
MNVPFDDETITSSSGLSTERGSVTEEWKDETHVGDYDFPDRSGTVTNWMERTERLMCKKAFHDRSVRQPLTSKCVLQVIPHTNQSFEEKNSLGGYPRPISAGTFWRPTVGAKLFR